MRLQLFGEKLVAFRDSRGCLSLIDEFWAHRCVLLWSGRNEQCGLRRPYHGWEPGVTGQCVDLSYEGAADTQST